VPLRRAIGRMVPASGRALQARSLSAHRATVAHAMNRLTVSPARLKQLRAICLALPEASEKVAWGDPTFRVKDKIAPKSLAARVGTTPAKARRKHVSTK
jgi:hypothetical protein